MLGKLSALLLMAAVPDEAAQHYALLFEVVLCLLLPCFYSSESLLAACCITFAGCQASGLQPLIDFRCSQAGPPFVITNTVLAVYVAKKKSTDAFLLLHAPILLKSSS
jgi:hypothetical protein